MGGDIAFKVPVAGPSFAGILVSYESDGKIDGNGVRGDVGTGYTNLCNTLVNNKANKPASN
ncbi:hypothetical protein GJA_2019 [Janthinobacterium agaricidamnosum NBRC 102515 = DSM 9628]|uniref:Uncharacterized protein n=1 Tax=Janthinobacterium agaricidamnosum NBRC 102515 = DSM 9628 TaxID=1349767 RepID=W0V4X9_9BURK|nr:hypothetical protein GJA_2019 [Janthinobacterium agaricidamnosum NBRC 102515 = DSM 9628]